MSTMPKFFQTLSGLVVPQEKILKDPKIRGHVVVQDFLHDEIDQEASMRDLDEDLHFLYGDQKWSPEGEEDWFWYQDQQRMTARERREQEENERLMIEESRDAHWYYH